MWISFHRKELQRQRDFLRGIWRWYLLPMMPGLAVLLIGGAVVNPDRLSRLSLLPPAVMAFFFYFVGRVNRRKAEELQQEIDALDAVEKAQ